MYFEEKRDKHAFIVFKYYVILFQYDLGKKKIFGLIGIIDFHWNQLFPATAAASPWATATASTLLGEATVAAVVKTTCKDVGEPRDNVDERRTVDDGEAVNAAVSAYK